MKNSFWSSKKVLVTGGAGFIGSHLSEKLLALGAEVFILDRFSEHNRNNLSKLKNRAHFIKGDCTYESDAFHACKDKDIVLNLAAKVGSIAFNRMHQATMLHDNLLIATMMLDAARRAGVERFLMVSASCIYPRNCSIPTPEKEGFVDEPEPTNAGYGWAKRVAELLSRYYQEEFRMKIGIVRPYNCYGPRDDFDPAVSHVIPGLIKRILDGEDPLIVWGSGKQTRSFLYVDDLVDGMLLAIEKYPVADPINLGIDESVTIRDLVFKIVRIIGVKRKVIFDINKPDGSPKKGCDTHKAAVNIGFKAKITIDEGLKRTIRWYMENRV